ncbi:hypothetical protein CNMCM6936_007607 [Aspergillus lentulus]|nr:hypothetical protein CNMCM6936_007607 [Aspergillus lentulus]GFF74473.1 hypothetical protein IFM62136_08831 [Aspergillus lentulus]
MASYSEQSSTEIEDFLQSIPEVNDFLSGESSRKPHRADIFQAIQRRIKQLLSVTTLGEDHWTTELAELDLDKNSTSDEANSITSILTSYVLNRPWVFQPWLVQRKLENRNDRFSDASHVPMSPLPESHTGHGSILAFEDLAEMVTHDVAKTDHIGNEVIVVNKVERVSNKPEILGQSDAALGLAGFSPWIEKATAEDGNTDPEPRLITDIEDDYINQYRKHVQLAGTPSRQCARISFSQRDPRRSEASSTIATKILVDHGFMNFESQVTTLEDVVGPLDQLLFIHHVSSKSESQTDGDEDYAEIVSIQMKEIDEFIDAYWKCRNLFEESAESSEDESHGFRFASIGLFATHLLSFVHPAFLIFTAGSFFYKFLRRFGFNRPSDVLILQKLTPLMKSMEPLLKALRVGQFNGDRNSNSAQSEVLHLTALVVQALNLILQSYLRGSETPFRFEFLTAPIFDFVLEGANPSPEAPKIYAGSHRLSCLGDMLRKEVLVFGLQNPLLQKRLDVIATPAQVAAMWGPAEFVIRRTDCLLLFDEGEQDVVDSQMDIPTPGKMTISGIKIHNGMILPSDETDDAIPKWHWTLVNQAEYSMRLICETNIRVDLHTRIRIGDTNGLHLTPIGPAYWNQSCRRSMSFEELQSNFQIPGASDPCIEMKNFTVGLQSGEYMNFIAQATFEKVPGRTAKEVLLTSKGLFEFQISEFDEMWGLFVSLCTGVMTRVRLRDLVAFVCLHVPGQIPKLPGNSYEASLDAFVQALSGEEHLTVWLASLVLESEQRDLSTRQSLEWLQERILSLFRNVLAMLKDTGISKNGDLHLAFLNEQRKNRMLVLSARDHPWTKILSDSSITATFACVSPYCFETIGHTCQEGQWKLPDKFRLSTKLNTFTRHLRGTDGPGETLQIGKRYCINAPHLDMVAKVDRLVDVVGQHSFYSITAKKRRVPLFVSQHIRRRADLREEDSASAFKCIISGYGN